MTAAIDYLENIGFEQIQKQEDHLTEMLMGEIRKIPFVHVMGSENPIEHHGIVAESEELQALRKELKSCVDREDFERACEVRDKIKAIEGKK